MMQALIIVSLWILAGMHGSRMYVRSAPLYREFGTGGLFFTFFLTLLGPFGLGMAIMAAPEAFLKKEGRVGTWYRNLDKRAVAERIFRP